ncbi:MAG: hypothetical protein VX519_11420 [Myxococcota bacterium]|nr:hypothetical protein [Myxococcota bacterium]
MIRECKSCGAVVEFPEGNVSISCSYCASPLVDSERAKEEVSAVAPFRIQRSVAEQKLKEHLAGHFWAPAEVRKGMVRDHLLQGVLVPFWVFQGVARSHFSARVGIHWWRTETYVDDKGNVRTRQVRETEWFSHSGSAICALDGQLVSASTGLPEAESNALEPFDLGRAEPFDARLVSGWSAELPSIGRDTADGTCVEEVRTGEAARVATRLLPGDEAVLKDIQTHVDIEEASLVMLPVWMASYRHGDEVYRQLVNGQTGLCVGEVPTSKLKIFTAVVGAMLAALVIFLLVSQWN